MKLFEICLVVFSLQRKRVFHVNICTLVCDRYFGLLILLITLFGSQQILSICIYTVHIHTYLLIPLYCIKIYIFHHRLLHELIPVERTWTKDLHIKRVSKSTAHSLRITSIYLKKISKWGDNLTYLIKEWEQKQEKKVISGNLCAMESDYASSKCNSLLIFG